MAPAPQVSVIVPVYNAGKYLAPCLDSILAQTLKEIEVVCVDDGSTDGSPALLDEYAARDPRVAIIHQANGGSAVARNAGLEAASAPYIGFVDSDDWIEPETYETALAVMLGDEEIDFVAWGYDRVARPGARVSKGMQKTVRKSSGRFSGKRAVDDAVFLETNPAVWNKLYRTALIRAHQIAFPPGIAPGQDVAFSWKYRAWARYGFFLNACLYHYLYRDDSVWNPLEASKTFTAFSFLGVVRDVLEYYRRHTLLLDKGRLLAWLVTPYIALGCRISCARDEYLRRAREVLDEFDLPDPGGGWAGQAYRALRRGQAPAPELTWLEKVFSLTNAGPHKVLRFLGLKLKFPRRNHARKEA
jgi:glycosyltransferase involved in cell wall biosynthesis